jgi:WD40 repeat protein
MVFSGSGRSKGWGNAFSWPFILFFLLTHPFGNVFPADITHLHPIKTDFLAGPADTRAAITHDGKWSLFWRRGFFYSFDNFAGTLGPKILAPDAWLQGGGELSVDHLQHCVSVIAGHGVDRAIVTQSLSDGERRASYPWPGHIEYPHLLPGRVANFGMSLLSLWDLQKGVTSPRTRLEIDSQRMKGRNEMPVLSPREGFLAVLFGLTGPVSLWNPITGALILDLPSNPWAYVNFSSEDKYFAVTSPRDGLFEFYSLPNGELVKRQKMPGGLWYRWAFSPTVESEYYTHNFRELAFWSLEHSEEQPKSRVSWHISRAAIDGGVYSPDGKQFALTLRTGQIYLVDLETLKPQFELLSHDGEIKDLLFSKDGRTLLTTDMNGKIAVWLIPEPTGGSDNEEVWSALSTSYRFTRRRISDRVELFVE